MTGRYLEITFRKGRPLAAYLYLPRREGDRSARTDDAGDGLVVDFAADGRPIGIEILAPGRVGARAINQVLRRLGIDELSQEELAPVVGAA